MPPTTSVQVKMRVLGEEQINRRMLRFSGRAGNAMPVWEAISEYLMKVEEKQFDSEGAYSGHPWAALSESWLAEKARRGLDPRVGHATLAMRRALTVRGDRNQRLQMTRRMMRFGVKNLTYPEIVQKKQPNSGGRPRRPVDLTERNKVEMVKMIQLWIARGVTSGVPLP